MRDLKWEMGDAPPLDWLPAHDRRDVEEVNTTRLVGTSCKEVLPWGFRVPVLGLVFQGHLAKVLRDVRWIRPLVYILPA